jgi:hypothetical protein
MNSSAPIRADVSEAVRVELVVEPWVERGETVARAGIEHEQQRHRIAVVAMRRLHADEHVAQPDPSDADRGAVRVDLTGRPPQKRLTRSALSPAARVYAAVR